MIQRQLLPICNNPCDAWASRDRARYRLAMQRRIPDWNRIFATAYARHCEGVFPLRPEVNLGPYRADFLVTPWLFTIEIDEPYHNQLPQRLRDHERDVYLQTEFGLPTHRIPQAALERDEDECVRKVLKLQEYYAKAQLSSGE